MLAFMGSKKFLSWFVLHTVLLGISILIMFFYKKRTSSFLFSSTSISLDGRLGYFSAFLSPLKRRFHLFGGRPTFGHLFVSRLLVPALFIHFDVRTGGGPLMRFQARRPIP